MRKRLLGVLLGLLLLIVLLAPAAHMMQKNLPNEGAQDAEHLVEPMQRLLAGSPQLAADAAVGPIMEIEAAWAIEDTREEAYDEPLVVGMRNGESELGYDRESRTFYCTVGMNEEDDWPELALFAQSADGAPMQAAWIDDYSYDFRSDAVAMGYRYEFLAYTDTQYEYVGVVFTGMPIVTLEVEEGTEIGDSYVPSRMAVSSAEHAAVNHGALVHLRGGGSVKPIDKPSYRMEFHEQSSGEDKKAALSILGMEEDTDWLLIANAQERTAVRNHLCFGIWDMWNPDGNAPALLQSRLVELFVGDAYMGLYQLLERIDPAQEIERMGGNADTDAMVRLVARINVDEYPTLDVKEKANFFAECRYAPKGRADAAFEQFEDYIALSALGEHALSDEAFDHLASRCIDAEAMMSYFLYSQVCGFEADNVFNNLYIWMIRQDGGSVYRLSPWDMDLTLPIARTEQEMIKGISMELSFAIPCRMLELNVNGCRQILWKIWEEKRGTIVSDDAIYAYISGVEEMVNRSGAYLRESEKWYGEAQPLNLAEILYYTTGRLKNMDMQMQEMWPLETSF